MKTVTLIGIGLYSVANLFAGTFDLIVTQSLPMLDAFALLLSGLVFVATFYFVWKERAGWFWMVIIALGIASAIAVFNERVLGLGHPSHHIYRGTYTLIVFVAAYILLRKKRQTH